MVPHHCYDIAKFQEICVLFKCLLATVATAQLNSHATAVLLIYSWVYRDSCISFRVVKLKVQTLVSGYISI